MEMVQKAGGIYGKDVWGWNWVRSPNCKDDGCATTRNLRCRRAPTVIQLENGRYRAPKKKWGTTHPKGPAMSCLLQPQVWDSMCA